MHRTLRVCDELPPRQALGEDSSIRTDAPASVATSAAHNAALPPPITKTSGLLFEFIPLLIFQVFKTIEMIEPKD
jgi:hypothetical protein